MSHVLFLHGPLRVDEVWGASQLLTARDSEDMTSIPADDSDIGGRRQSVLGSGADVLWLKDFWQWMWKGLDSNGV